MNQQHFGSENLRRLFFIHFIYQKILFENRFFDDRVGRPTFGSNFKSLAADSIPLLQFLVEERSPIVLLCLRHWGWGSNRFLEFNCFCEFMPFFETKIFCFCWTNFVLFMRGTTAELSKNPDTP